MMTRITLGLQAGACILLLLGAEASPSAASGSRLGSPADYERPGHVSESVISDVARWVAER